MLLMGCVTINGVTHDNIIFCNESGLSCYSNHNTLCTLLFPAVDGLWMSKRWLVVDLHDQQLRGIAFLLLKLLCSVAARRAFCGGLQECNRGDSTAPLGRDRS